MFTYLRTFVEQRDEEERDPCEREGPAAGDGQPGEQEVPQVVAEPHPHMHHGNFCKVKLFSRRIRSQFA